MTAPVRVVRVGADPVRSVSVFAGPQGAAGMVWLGAWSSTATYVALDAVSNGGSSYICTAPVGPSATAPGSDGAHWAMLAQAGTNGTGTVNGPASSTTGHLATYADATGKNIADGGAVPTLASLGGAPTTRLVSAGTGLSGGGDLSADRSLAVSYGTAAGTSAQGNDSRFVGVPVTTQTAAYTLVLADAGSIVEVNSASAVNVTIPASIFAAGQIVEVHQYGPGQVTIVAGSGVTLRAANGLKTAKQYSSASVRFRSATEAVVSGDTAV